MSNYNFYCSKCGHNKSLPTKSDWLLEKKEHKRRGCELVAVPNKEGILLVRPQFAAEAFEGMKILEQEKQASLTDSSIL